LVAATRGGGAAHNDENTGRRGKEAVEDRAVARIDASQERVDSRVIIVSAVHGQEQHLLLNYCTGANKADDVDDRCIEQSSDVNGARKVPRGPVLWVAHNEFSVGAGVFGFAGEEAAAGAWLPLDQRLHPHHHRGKSCPAGCSHI
jgi:hypothetical protein